MNILESQIDFAENDNTFHPKLACEFVFLWPQLGVSKCFLFSFMFAKEIGPLLENEPGGLKMHKKCLNRSKDSALNEI